MWKCSRVEQPLTEVNGDSVYIVGSQLLGLSDITWNYIYDIMQVLHFLLLCCVLYLRIYILYIYIIQWLYNLLHLICSPVLFLKQFIVFCSNLSILLFCLLFYLQKHGKICFLCWYTWRNFQRRLSFSLLRELILWSLFNCVLSKDSNSKLL